MAEKVFGTDCGDKNWQPKDDSRVCSVHFIDKKPTLLNPYPTLHLGYSDSVEVKTRLPPARRCLIPVKPQRSNKNALKLNTSTNLVAVTEQVHDQVQVSEDNSSNNQVNTQVQVSEDNSNNNQVNTVSIEQEPENTELVHQNHSQNDSTTLICIENDHDYLVTCQGCADKCSIICKLKAKIRVLEEVNMKLKGEVIKKN